MFRPEEHEMHIKTKYPSGTELWYCPTCGRQFLLDWPPAYQRIILEAGDEYAIHKGGKGGLSMGPLEIGEVKEPVLPETVIATVNRILEKFDLDKPPDNSAQNDQ